MFIELSNGTVAYELLGDTQSELVVLVPGLTMPMSMWDPTFSFLIENRFRVLRFDLYGRGSSAYPDVDYTYELFVEQLEELLKRLGLNDKFYLYGSSLGGAIATKFALKNPQKIKKLIIEGPTGVSRKVRLQDKLLVWPLLGELIFFTILPILFRKHLRDILLKPELYPEFCKRALEQAKNSLFRRSLLKTIRFAAVVNLEETFRKLAELDFPKLIFWGEQDQITPISQLETLKVLVGQVELETFEESGHLPHLEEPDLHNEKLLKFLKS